MRVKFKALKSAVWSDIYVLNIYTINKTLCESFKKGHENNSNKFSIGIPPSARELN